MTVVLWTLLALLIPIIQSKDYTGFVHNSFFLILPSYFKETLNSLSYKLFKVPNTENVVKFIEGFNIYELNGVDIMLVNRNTTHALVPPQVQFNFEKLLQQMNASYSVDESVQSKIDVENLRRRTGRKGLNESNFFDAIQPLKEINSYVFNLVRRHSKIAKVVSIGKSYEGNDLVMVVISNSNKPKPKLVYIEAGLHAREWIAPETALYFLIYILENYDSLSDTLRDIEINVLPVANPDGYKHTFTSDRLWRKNRQPNPGSQCLGVDLNRNFGFHWGETGTSSDPCSESYGGDRSFSSLESTYIARHLIRNSNRLISFVDLHSYGKFIFYPYGYRKKTFSNKQYMEEVSERIEKAISKNRGTKYEIGTAADLIYESAGGVDDYAAGVVGIPLTFTIELPHDDFLVPPEEVEPIGKETAEGLVELMRIVAEYSTNV